MNFQPRAPTPVAEDAAAEVLPIRDSVRSRFRIRWTVSKVLFVAIFVVPLLLLIAFQYLIVSDRYESTASAVMTEEKTSGTTIDLSVLGITNAAADRDAYTLKEFIESHDMLSHVQEQLKFREHASHPDIDFWSRLKADAPKEDFLEYYHDLVTVSFDTESKILRFSVQAFDAPYAQQLLNLVVKRSQEFIDRMNEQVTGEQLRFFDLQIANSEKRLSGAKDRLVQFQRLNKLLTTEGESATIMATVGALEQALAQKQSDLNARLSVLDKTAPQLTTLRLEIGALQVQIGREKERLAGGQASSLSELDSQYREISLNLEFMTNLYKSNLNALESARLEAARRLKFLIVVAQPSRAELSLYPNRIYIVITAAIVLLALYFLVSLLIAIIREHS